MRKAADRIVAGMRKPSVWTRQASKLLGPPAPVFPVDDYIGQQILWDKRAVKAMSERISATSGMSWQLSLPRAREFSEYLLYGTFVANSPAFAAEHEIGETNLAYADAQETELDEQWIWTMMADAHPDQVALCFQSYSETEVGRIRSAMKWIPAARARKKARNTT